MANDYNDIDQLFRNQFEDYKDHSVNPSNQWAAFEQMLDAEQGFTAKDESKIIKLNKWFKPLSIAASIALFASVSYFALNNSDEQSKQINESVSVEFDQSNTIISPSVSHSIKLESRNLIEESSLIQNESSVTYNAENIALSEQNFEESTSNKVSKVLAYQESFDSDIADAQNLGNSAFANQGSLETPAQLSESNNQRAFEATSTNRALRSFASFMPRLSLSNHSSTDLQNENRSVDFNDYVPSTKMWGIAFVRIGARFGTGESNTDVINHFWTANAVASLGYKKPLKSRMGVMAELAYLRRSGNGLERNQNLEVGRVYSAFNNSVNSTNVENTPSFTVDRSIVATRLDYVQIPVSAYFEPTLKSELNAGAYVDYLFKAKNDAYTVYNQKDYINRLASDDELKTLDGLNKIRFGLSAGARYDIMKNMSLDVRTMIPLNSAFSKNADISAYKPANQALDFIFSLRYSI